MIRVEDNTMALFKLTDLTLGIVVEDRFIIFFFTFVILTVPHVIKPVNLSQPNDLFVSYLTPNF